MRWVEEHLSGRSKRNKDHCRGRELNHRQVTGLFYDQSLLPLHLKLDSSCRLLNGDASSSQSNHRYDVKGECEREDTSLATGRPEPYDTIALCSRENGNWVTNSHLEASNPLRHSQFLGKLIVTL